jgi:hypothetical protein
MSRDFVEVTGVAFGVSDGLSKSGLEFPNQVNGRWDFGYRTSACHMPHLVPCSNHLSPQTFNLPKSRPIRATTTLRSGLSIVVSASRWDSVD